MLSSRYLLPEYNRGSTVCYTNGNAQIQAVEWITYVNNQKKHLPKENDGQLRRHQLENNNVIKRRNGKFKYIGFIMRYIAFKMSGLVRFNNCRYPEVRKGSE